MREIEELMTPDQVAKKLNLAKSTVYAMAHRGLIPAIKLGKSLRIRPEALVKFLEQQEKKSYGIAA